MAEFSKSNNPDQALFVRVGNARCRITESCDVLEKLTTRIFGAEPERPSSGESAYDSGPREAREATFMDEARWLEEAAERLNGLVNRISGIMS